MILLQPEERDEMERQARLKIIKEYDKQIVEAYATAIREVIQ